MDDTTIWLWILVGFGGAVGAILRVAISTSVQQWQRTPFPIGTFAVNLIGSWAVGVVLGSIEVFAVPELMQALLISGVLGAFTTFSTFSLDNLQLLESGNIGGLLMNAGGQFLGGLLLIFLGFQLTVWVWS